MSSKIMTTVVAAAIVVPFSLFAADDAVSIWQDLHKQQEQIQQLTTDNVKLDKTLYKAKEVKTKSLEEVQKIEQEAAAFASKRQQLEKALGAE